MLVAGVVPEREGQVAAELDAAGGGRRGADCAAPHSDGNSDLTRGPQTPPGPPVRRHLLALQSAGLPTLSLQAKFAQTKQQQS